MKDINLANAVYIGQISPETLLVDKFYGVEEQTHPFWEMIIYYEGEGDGFYEGNHYRFTPETAVALPPQTPHSEHSEEGHCSYHIFLPMLITDAPAMVVRDPSGSLIGLARILLSVFRQKQGNYIGVCNSLAFAIFDYIKNLNEKKVMSKHTKHFMAVIKDNLTNPTFELAAEAHRYGITQHHLRHCFRKDIGKTPLEYLQEIRMEMARNLLIVGNSRIKDIAVRCGYLDPYYFSRVFTKFYGISPDGFRNSMFKTGKTEPEN